MLTVAVCEQSSGGRRWRAHYLALKQFVGRLPLAREAEYTAMPCAASCKKFVVCPGKKPSLFANASPTASPTQHRAPQGRLDLLLAAQILEFRSLRRNTFQFATYPCMALTKIAVDAAPKITIEADVANAASPATVFGVPA